MPRESKPKPTEQTEAQRQCDEFNMEMVRQLAKSCAAVIDDMEATADDVLISLKPVASHDDEEAWAQVVVIPRKQPEAAHGIDLREFLYLSPRTTAGQVREQIETAVSEVRAKLASFKAKQKAERLATYEKSFDAAAEKKAFASYSRLEDQLAEAIRKRPEGMTRSEINHHPLLRSVNHQIVNQMLDGLTDFGTLEVWESMGPEGIRKVFRHHALC